MNLKDMVLGQTEIVAGKIYIILAKGEDHTYYNAGYAKSKDLAKKRAKNWGPDAEVYESPENPKKFGLDEVKDAMDFLPMIEQRMAKLIMRRSEKV